MTHTLDGPESGRRQSKSPEAFRTISEVATDLNVPQHVLRFWETKFAQIRPLKRGGGRRYYRPEDIELLRRIRALLYNEGYTIKGVQKVLRENGKGDHGRPVPEAPPPAPAAAPAPVAPPAPVAAAPAGDGNRSRLEAALDELVAIRDALKRLA